MMQISNHCHTVHFECGMSYNTTTWRKVKKGVNAKDDANCVRDFELEFRHKNINIYPDMKILFNKMYRKHDL